MDNDWDNNSFNVTESKTFEGMIHKQVATNCLTALNAILANKKYLKSPFYKVYIQRLNCGQNVNRLPVIINQSRVKPV